MSALLARLAFKSRPLARAAVGLALLAGAALPQAAQAVPVPLVFDSQAEFSGVQGQDGWSYGYYATPGNVGSFTLMTNFLGQVNLPSGGSWAESSSQPPWTLLWSDGGHPAGTNYGGPEHWAVRRWTSDVAGVLSLQGSYGMANTGSTRVHVVVDGAELLLAQAVGGTPQAFTLSNVTVHVGSTVDFVIDPNGVDFSDSTTFTAQATAVPEAPVWLLMVAGGALLSRRRVGRAAR